MKLVTPPLSGVHFYVTYRVQGDEEQALARAKDITLEQTVEFPDDLLPEGNIRDTIVGQIVEFSGVSDTEYLARIGYAMETAGGDIVQLLNVIFGNISIKPGVRVEAVDLPDEITAWFKGPRFGRKGLRELLDAPSRPLLCTALKPMGLSPADLAEQAYQFALGGMDMIKDDHGINNQPFSPFNERVQRCAEAVERANHETGYHAMYMASLGARADQILERAHFAKQAGAGAILVMPGLVGMDTMRLLAEEDTLALPVMSHPAFQGSFVTSPTTGIGHGVLFGLFARLAGADATVYPNYGGRFSFSKEECIQIVKETERPLGNLRQTFPAPGGGMTMDRVPEMLEVYGRELIFLIGGGLHRIGPDLVQNTRSFRDLVERM